MYRNRIASNETFNLQAVLKENMDQTVHTNATIVEMGYAIQMMAHAGVWMTWEVAHAKTVQFNYNSTYMLLKLN